MTIPINRRKIGSRMQDEPAGKMVASVGVFDSGVGGLSVLQAMRRELPHEHFLYVADSGCAPYGDRSAAFVVERAITITDFMVQQGAKAVVVACNTATGAAVESLRARFAIPIVAIEPAVKPAALRTRSRVVGVLATTGTLSSPNMGRLLDNYGRRRPDSALGATSRSRRSASREGGQGSGEPRRSEAEAGADVEFVIQPCPGLADLVEKGEIASEETRALVKRYVQPIVTKGADILVLGCTHYPFLRPLIEEVAGPGVDVIDPAMAVARELRRRIESAGLLNGTETLGRERFWTTGDATKVQPIVSLLWGKDVEVAGLKAGIGG